MVASIFDRLTRPAAVAVSLRTSLLALARAGSAAVAAAALAVAEKAANTVRELGERQREQCRTYFVERCQGSHDCLEALLPCCEPFADCYGAADIGWIYPI